MENRCFLPIHLRLTRWSVDGHLSGSLNLDRFPAIPHGLSAWAPFNVYLGFGKVSLRKRAKKPIWVKCPAKQGDITFHNLKDAFHQRKK
jgi:hypothetical protein